MAKSVYQFKITLKKVSPPIWRRIQVPNNYTFYDLHIAIQDAMGWDGYHLHEFQILDPKTGRNVALSIPEDMESHGIIPSWKKTINKYFSEKNKTCLYIYDFGDYWEHQVQLEKILPATEATYPICLAGKRACPPEDCGGPYGYEELLEIIANPKHKEYQNIMEWLEEDFDPEQFDPQQVTFYDPKASLAFLLDALE